MEQPLFGQRLRELRMSRGLSQAALAGSGMSTSYLSRLESGIRRPTPKAVSYLSERLGVPASTFDSVSSSPFTQALAMGVSAADRNGVDAALKVLASSTARSEGGDPALHWQALWLLTSPHGSHDESSLDASAVEELARIGDDLGIPELQVRARARLSRYLRLTGSPELGREAAEEAVAIARGNDVPVTDLVRALLDVISSAAESGRLPQARQYAEELGALVDDGTCFTPELVAKARWSMASVLVRSGESQAARDMLERAMRDLDSRDDLLLWTRLRLAAASLYLQMRPLLTDLAAARLAEIEVPIALIATPRHAQEYRMVKAQLAFHQGAYAEAEELCAALLGEELLLSFRDQMRFDMLRIRLKMHLGHAAEAVVEMTALAGRLQQSANSDLAAEALSTLAETLAETTPRNGAGSAESPAAEPR